MLVIKNLKTFLKRNSLTRDNFCAHYSGKILLTDLCPMMAVLLPLSLIFDKTRNIAKVFSLYGLLGGLLTIYGNLIFMDEIDTPYWRYLLLGEDPNQLLFSAHYLTSVLSLLVLVNSKKFTKWSFLGTIIFGIIYISYVLTVTNIFNVRTNATGLQDGDWYSIFPENFFWFSQYQFLQNLTPFLFPFNVLFWYIIAFVVICTFIVTKNFLTFDLNNVNTPLWSRKVKWLDIHVKKADSFMNNILSFIERPKKIKG